MPDDEVSPPLPPAPPVPPAALLDQEAAPPLPVYRPPVRPPVSKDKNEINEKNR